MEKKINDVIDKIGMLLIVIALATFNLIIGGNDKPLQILPLGIFTGLSFLLLFGKKIIYKEQLIKSKIDIVVSIFMGTLFLPLVFGTYCSMQGTVEFIQKYIFVYSMYLLVRNVVNSKKRTNIIISTTIVSSLFIIILGIDLQTNHYFDWLIKELNLEYMNDYRFTSTFGYTNAVAIYLSFCVFLAINRIENKKNKIEKILYILYAILGTSIIIISYSRVVFVIHLFALLVYLSAKIYKRIKDNKKMIIIVFTIIVLVIICFTIYILIALQYPTIFNKKVPVTFRKVFESNTEYTFTFDADVISTPKDQSRPQLILYAVNEYSNEIEIGRLPLSLKEKINQIKIKTPDKVLFIKFVIINTVDKKVVINHCYINGEEYIINYKYIPKVLYRLITTFSIKDLSVVKRIHYYSNCLQIAKDSLIVGHGGNTWRYLSVPYEDHPYAVKETHSYLFELLISYGIIGLYAFTSIIVLFTTKMFKQFKTDKDKKKQMLSIFIGLMLLIVYNYLFDFGLSFVVILLVAFIYIALMQFESEEKLNLKIIDYIALLVIGIVMITLISATIAKYVVQDPKTKTLLAPYIADYQYAYINESETLDKEELKEFIIKHPYAKNTYKNQNELYKLYWNAIFDKAKTMEKDELINDINFGIESFKTIKNVNPVDFDSIIERAKLLLDVVNKLKNIDSIIDTENMIQNIKKIMLDEYYERLEYIQDSNRNQNSIDECARTIKNYKRILQNAGINME